MTEPTQRRRKRPSHPATRDRGEAEHFDQTPPGGREDRRRIEFGSDAAGPADPPAAAASSARQTREKGN